MNRSLREVELAYEAFCAENHYTELDFEENEAVFAAAKVFRDTRTDNSTESYIRLQWKAPKDLAPFAVDDKDGIMHSC